LIYYSDISQEKEKSVPGIWLPNCNEIPNTVQIPEIPILGIGIMQIEIDIEQTDLSYMKYIAKMLIL